MNPSCSKYLPPSKLCCPQHWAELSPDLQGFLFEAWHKRDHAFLRGFREEAFRIARLDAHTRTLEPGQALFRPPSKPAPAGAPRLPEFVCIKPGCRLEAFLPHVCCPEHWEDLPFELQTVFLDAVERGDFHFLEGLRGGPAPGASAAAPRVPPAAGQWSRGKARFRWDSDSGWQVPGFEGSEGGDGFGSGRGGAFN